jgi:hypothetical protein
VVANGAAQHGITGFEGIQHGPLCHRTLDFEGDFTPYVRQRPEMGWKDNADHAALSNENSLSHTLILNLGWDLLEGCVGQNSVAPTALEGLGSRFPGLEAPGYWQSPAIAGLDWVACSTGLSTVEFAGAHLQLAGILLVSGHGFSRAAVSRVGVATDAATLTGFVF